MQFNKNKPQNVSFKDQKSGSSIDIEEKSDVSSENEDIELNHSRSLKEPVEPTLGFHSTLINNEMDIDLNKEPQEEVYDMFDTTKIEKNWKKIHWSIWKKREEDTNLFFYYFHNFNEKLDITPFTTEEEEILLITLVQLASSTTSIEKAKNRVKGKWGFISLKIPNRNGLICYQNYLKIRLRRGEYKNDELFLDYLKKKIGNEEVVSKIDDETFLEFFMNLDPGYSNKPEQADFWIKEAARNLKTEEAIVKIKKIEKYIKESKNDNDYCFVPNKELQKKNFELLLVSISNHPYVKIHSNKRTPSYSGLKSAQSKETRDTSSKKDEGKSSATSKAVTTTKKPKRLRIDEAEDEGLITPDRVDRSTDISNPQQEQNALLIENEGNLKEDDAKITPEPSATGKVYRNLKTPVVEKKIDPPPRKINEEKRQETLKLMKKYNLEFPKKDEVESYDSEPDKRINKNPKELPCFFSDLSSISSDEDNKKSDFLTEGFSALGIKAKDNKIIPEETGTGKRKAHQAGIVDEKREKKVKTSKPIKRGFFEEEIIKPKKPRAKKTQVEPKKKKFRRLKKSKQKTLSNSKIKKETIDPTIEDSKEIIKKDVIKYTDRSLIDYADGENDAPKVQSKLDNYFIPKELNKEAEEKRIKAMLTSENLCEELNEIFGKLENMAEKLINLPKYEVSQGFIQDEDKSLESYYCCLKSLHNQLKQYTNTVTSFSLALFGKYDPGMILMVRRASTIFNDVEKDFHRVSKFSIKESTLKSSGEIGQLCLKSIAQIEQLFIKLFQLEGSSLSFILSVTESGYSLSEEQVIKENLAHILKVYKNITQFFKQIDSFSKVQKPFKTFINENLYLYFLCSMYIRKNSTLIQFPLIEEFAAVLLIYSDERENLISEISRDLIEKSQSALKSACLSNSEVGNSRSSGSGNDSIFNISKKNNSKTTESALALLKRKNYDDKDNSYYEYLVIQFLKYLLKLEFKLHDLVSDPTFLSNLIKVRFADFYLLVVSHIKLFQHRLNQYILKPVPDMRLSLLDSIHDSMATIFLCSSTETDFNHSLECAFYLPKRLPLKMPYFMKIYEVVCKSLKPDKQNQSILKLEKIPIEKACQYDYTSINFYINLAHELHTVGVTQALKSMGNSRHMILGLILELCFNNEKSLDENEQEKINRRIASRSLSLIHNFGNIEEDAVKDPRILKLFLFDFCLVLSIINLSRSSQELLKSSYLKITSFVNLQKSHRVIKTLVLSLQIDLINYCIQYAELYQIVKETFDTTLNVLSSLLNEFLEISRLQNHLNKIDNSKGDESDIRLQKLIEQIMLKLRNAIISNIEFVLEHKVNLLPKGLTFLKILNPNNPVTTGLRREILDYLELILMSKDRVHDIIRQNKIRSPTSTPYSQSPHQDEYDFMEDVLQREQKNQTIMNNLVAWRQIALENGKDILTLLHDLIMSVYNKDIMTTIHHRYHVDIFLVEKSLELYSIYSKLLILEGKITFDDIEKKLGFGSMFYLSKGSKDKFAYQNEDRMKGAILSRNSKLSLLLRFYTKFLSFEKAENDKFMASNFIKGVENFISDSHLVLLLASIESVSDISIVQKDYYNHMADFALIVGSQGMTNPSSGFNQFLLNAYVERGFQNSEDSRDATEVLKRIFYNLQIALAEANENERAYVAKFIDNLLTKFVKYLRQDLIDEAAATNNGKFFGVIYKNICGLVSQLSNLYVAGGSTKAFTELLSLILVDNFNKNSFNLSDEHLQSYDPYLIKLLIKDNILFDFKTFLEAVFSVPSKDKHFPRKVFVKLLAFLLKKDIENVTKLKNDPENAKLKKWELLFKKDLDITLYGETFLQNLFNCCEKLKHTETFLNCIRELVNLSMVSQANFNLSLPLLRCVYPIIKEMDMNRFSEKLIDLFSKVTKILDQTPFSDEERISVLYIISYLYKKTPSKFSDPKLTEGIQVINYLCFKWIVHIILLFDENIVDKLQSDGYDFTNFELEFEPSGEETKEINEIQVKIFELCLRIYHESEKQTIVDKPFATELKELIQEKIKINLAMGEGRMSGETKNILQILNEY